MRRESTGFWSIDSSKLLRSTKEPYLLPIHAQQAFFYKNPDGNPWWQIVHVNPRELDTMNCATLEDLNRPSSSTLVEARDEHFHIMDMTSNQNIVATTSSSDEEVDKDDMMDNDEDLSEFDIEQNQEHVRSNVVQLPPELDIDLTEEELKEAQADNNEVVLIVDLFAEP